MSVTPTSNPGRQRHSARGDLAPFEVRQASRKSYCKSCAKLPNPLQAIRSGPFGKKNPTMSNPDNSTEEIWKPVHHYIGTYSVSDWGRVRSEERVVRRRLPNGEYIGHTVPQKILSTPPNADGYLIVRLTRNGVATTRYVHDLVARSFLGVKKPGKEVRHLDDDKANARLSNLAYGTRSQNMLDCVRNGHHQFASRTACAAGHEYTAQNTFRRPDRPGTRICLTCESTYQRRSKARQLVTV